MTYREGMEYTVRWSDGYTWKADGATFARVTQSLSAARETILGLAPVLARWSALAAQGNERPVDEFAFNEADRAVFTAGVARALEKGDRVELRGFGAFSVRRRAARQGRNPRTGATVKVAAKNVPFFKPGKELRAKVDVRPKAKAKAKPARATKRRAK